MIPGHVVGIEARKLTRSAVTRVATATALILAPAGMRPRRWPATPRWARRRPGS